MEDMENEMFNEKVGVGKQHPRGRRKKSGIESIILPREFYLKLSNDDSSCCIITYCLWA